MNSYAELVPTSSTRRFAAAALCAGALAAIALPGNRLGLGMVLVAWLAIAAVAISGTLPRSRYTALSLATPPPWRPWPACVTRRGCCGWT